MENRKSVEALHIDREGSGIRTEWTAREFPLTIMLNGEQLVTVLCSPGDLEALAVGFLFSEGIIRAKEEITGLTLDDERGIVRIRTAEDKTADGKLFMKRVLTTGCGRGMAFYSYADLDRKKKVLSDLRVTPEEVLSLSRRFQGASELYRTTHGVHSAALCDTREVLVFAEDIGRHNAVDKVLGRCLLEGIAVCRPDPGHERADLLGDPLQGGGERHPRPDLQIGADGHGGRPCPGAGDHPDRFRPRGRDECLCRGGADRYPAAGGRCGGCGIRSGNG